MITVSNSSPFARCSVITCTRAATSAAASARSSIRAPRRTPASPERRPRRRVLRAARNSARRRRDRSRRRSVAPPPSASHAPRTRSRERRPPARGDRRDAGIARRGRSARARRPTDPAIAAGASSNAAIECDGCASAAATTRDEIRQRQAAPRRAQHREPREAIGGLDERMRRARRDRAWPGARPARRARPPHKAMSASRNAGRMRSRCVRARTSTAIDRVAGRRARRERGATTRSRFADIVAATISTRAPAARRRVTARRSRAQRRPRLATDRCGRRARAGNTSLTHATSPACERKLRASTRLSTGTLADLLLRLGFDEDAHLGFAKAVDRLHRIADGEQRAPVTGLPSRGEPAQKLELRERRVLEFVDQQMIDPKIEREQQVGRRVPRCRGPRARPACPA